MLESLQIRNLALIKSLNIDFSNGLNVLSGETGAGKSLIINSIKLLLGKRAEKQLIRSGEEYIEMTALFTITNCEKNDKVNQILKNYNIDSSEDKQIVIRRLISENKSKNFLNSTLVPLKILSDIGEILLDVYAPGENFKLTNNIYQRQLVDGYGDNSLKDIQNTYDLWQQKILEKEQLLKNIPNKGELEILQHQLNELDTFDLNLETDKNIIQEYNQFANAEDLQKICQQSIYLLNEGEQSIAQQIRNFSRTVSELSLIDEEFYNQILAKTETILEEINNLNYNFDRYQNNITVNSQQVEYLNDRLNKLNILQKKFGPTIEDIAKYHQEISEKIALTLSYDETIIQISKEITFLKNNYQIEADKLTKQRQKTANILAHKIAEQLKELGFLNTKFRIEIKPTEPQRNGQDTIEFLISPNTGENFASLKKIASSGEISRIMLAIKSASASKDHTPILIFDEIDANIGGIIGFKVAKKINLLAQNKQIFSITHLAQVAAAATNHYFVEKEVKQGRMYIKISLLDDEDRKEEIARMFGDIDKSTDAINYATRLIKSFQ